MTRLWGWNMGGTQKDLQSHTKHHQKCTCYMGKKEVVSALCYRQGTFLQIIPFSYHPNPIWVLSGIFQQSNTSCRYSKIIPSLIQNFRCESYGAECGFMTKNPSCHHPHCWNFTEVPMTMRMMRILAAQVGFTVVRSWQVWLFKKNNVDITDHDRVQQHKYKLDKIVYISTKWELWKWQKLLQFSIKAKRVGKGNKTFWKLFWTFDSF